MSQRVIEELQIGQQILREEVRQLRTQLDLVMQLLTRREDSQPSYQPPVQQRYPVQPIQQQKHRNHGRRFDHIPMTYSQLLPHLLQLQLIELHTLNPPTVIPPHYDANARCEFHSGAPSHGTENCKALKNKVQDLIDKKQLTFGERIPLVNGQLLL